MKKELLKLEATGFEQMDAHEMSITDGGSFWEDVAYFLGAAAKSIVVFCKTASEFQHSLPPNLKK